MQTIIQTPFNIYFRTGKVDLTLNYEWIDHRLGLMSKYVLPSIIGQSDGDFYYVIQTRKETTNYVAEYIGSHAGGAKNIKVVSEEEYSKYLKSIITDKKFYEVRLNSDDLYHRDFVKRLKAVEIDPNTEAVIAENGYMWYMNKDVVVEREFLSPPFYGYVYGADRFLGGFRYNPKNGHPGVVKMRHKVMKERNWLWLVHDQNYKIMRGSAYPSYKKFKQVSNKILQEFGI